MSTINAFGKERTVYVRQPEACDLRPLNPEEWSYFNGWIYECMRCLNSMCIDHPHKYINGCGHPSIHIKFMLDASNLTTDTTQEQS